MFRITESWAEYTVSWNSDVHYNTPGSAEDVGAADDYYYFDATALVEGWYQARYPNWGMMILPEAPADNTRVFASRENADIYPQLAITYREQTPTPTRTRTRTPTPTYTRPPPPKTATRTPSVSTRTPTRTRTRTPNTSCTGDCNDVRRVSIDELLRGVNIALGIAAFDDCSVFDANADGRLAIDELVVAVGNALDGCAVRP